MAGRPTLYTSELGDAICDKIATSNRGLASICKDESFPSRSTVHKWITENKEFSDKYARARDDQADYLAEEILEIADDSSDDLHRVDDFGNRIENREFVNRSRIKIDARKWVASKLKPKKWGDKIQTEHSGSIGIEQITGMEVK